jgi:hypothetical protein
MTITDEMVDDLAVRVLESLLAEHVVENFTDSVLDDTMPDWLKLTAGEASELRARVLARVRAVTPPTEFLPQLLVGAVALPGDTSVIVGAATGDASS